MGERAAYPSDLTGDQWAYLPPKSATYYYFALWRDDGTDQTIHDLLRCQARERAGRREASRATDARHHAHRPTRSWPRLRPRHPTLGRRADHRPAALVPAPFESAGRSATTSTKRSSPSPAPSSAGADSNAQRVRSSKCGPTERIRVCDNINSRLDIAAKLQLAVPQFR